MASAQLVVPAYGTAWTRTNCGAESFSRKMGPSTKSIFRAHSKISNPAIRLSKFATVVQAVAGVRQAAGGRQATGGRQAAAAQNHVASSSERRAVSAHLVATGKPLELAWKSFSHLVVLDAKHLGALDGLFNLWLVLAARLALSKASMHESRHSLPRIRRLSRASAVRRGV